MLSTLSFLIGTSLVHIVWSVLTGRIPTEESVLTEKSVRLLLLTSVWGVATGTSLIIYALEKSVGTKGKSDRPSAWVEFLLHLLPRQRREDVAHDLFLA